MTVHKASVVASFDVTDGRITPVSIPTHIDLDDRGILKAVTLCPGCHAEIDESVCCCGSSTASHNQSDGHSPVPMGCVCHQERGTM